MKALYVICDGMADRPVRELGMRTPLQVAETPNMDRLAREGVTGIADPVAPGIPPGSDTANMALLGYDPYEHYTGRGGLEALGIGLELGPRDVAFRCNFATVDEGGVVLDRRAGRISTEHARTLAEAIRGALEEAGAELGVEAEFVPTVQHRAVLVLRGEGLSRAVSDTDPKENGKPMRECVPLVRGVCKAAGMEVLDVPGATGSYDTDLHAKFSHAVRALEGGADLALVHVKATDVASHDHKAGMKVKMIERIDEALGEALSELDLSEEAYVLLTADHTTSLRTGKHEGDPVPVVLAGPEVRPDGVGAYDELSCAGGGLCRLRGKDLMPVLMNLLGKVERFGF